MGTIEQELSKCNSLIEIQTLLCHKKFSTYENWEGLDGTLWDLGKSDLLPRFGSLNVAINQLLWAIDRSPDENDSNILEWDKEAIFDAWALITPKYWLKRKVQEILNSTSLSTDLSTSHKT